jgi:C-terminal processing protease CtpA/Prc
VQRWLPKLIAGAAAVLLLACASTHGSIGAVLGQDKTDGRVFIRQVPPQMTAARAGVEVGDEVLLIDGQDVRRMSPEAIHQALAGDEGTHVSLTILRHGQIQRIAVERGPLKPKH